MFNRENFEEYVFDYLEGRMPAGQEFLFIEFMKANPDLEEEIMAIREMMLKADPLDFPAKKNLFKLQYSAKEKILENSFEEAVVAYYEGDLDQKQKQNLEILIQNNDAFRDSFEKYSKTYLEPDKTIVFNKKASLKRLTIAQKRNRVFAAVSSAAAILILLIIFINPVKENVQTTAVQEQNTNRETITIPSLESVPAQAIRVNHPVFSGTALVSRQEEKPETISRQDLSLPLIASHSAFIPNSLKTEVFVFPAEYGNKSSGSEFMSIGEFARERLMVRVLNRNESGEERNNALLNLAMSGIEGFSNITDSDIYIEREINQEGKVERYTFETAFFGFSAPSGND